MLTLNSPYIIVNLILWIICMIISSYFDIKYLEVPNKIFFVALLFSGFFSIIQYSNSQDLFFFLINMGVLIVILYILSRIEALGGADLKSFLLFFFVSMPISKNINYSLIVIFFTLLIGFLYKHFKSKDIPLIPVIFIIGTILIII